MQINLRLKTGPWKKGGQADRPLSPLAFAVAYIMPLLLWWGHLQGGLFYFTIPVVIFGLLPVLDSILGLYLYNPDDAEIKTLLESRAFRLMAWAYVPIQIALVVWGAELVSAGSLQRYEAVGLTLSVGICTGGIGITLAHELMHKTSAWERLLSKILLLCVSYMHFFIEHLRGHHRRVSTPADPASARLGESFYRFYFRTLWGSWHDSWQLERQRLQKKKLAFWHWRNQMLWFSALPMLLAMGLLILWGPMATIFFVAQSVVAFSLLELVNYIEHYGLSRREIRPGIYEPINERHSWNANHLLTNCFLFMLQRHSDHHAHQSRRYQILRQFESSPQLPAGYATMILAALLPPLWFRIMNPRVAAFQRQEAPPEPTGAATAA